MRRKDREVTGLEEARRIVSACAVMRLAMADGARPYVVPMNFGAVWSGDVLTLYAHCAPAGRKLDILARNARVCVEMDCDGALLPGRTACEYGYRYSSLIGEGVAEIVRDEQEACEALSALMRHQTGREFAIAPQQARSVRVLRIRLQTWTAKVCAGSRHREEPAL